MTVFEGKFTQILIKAKAHQSTGRKAQRLGENFSDKAYLKMNNSSMGVSTTLEMSMASFRDRLYWAFSKCMPACLGRSDGGLENSIPPAKLGRGDRKLISPGIPCPG